MSLRRRRSHYRKVVFKWGLGILPNKQICQKSRQGILSKIARCVPPCPACHVTSSPISITIQIPFCLSKCKRKTLQNQIARNVSHSIFCCTLDIYSSSVSTCLISFAVAVTIRNPLSLISSSRLSSRLRCVDLSVSLFGKKNWSTDTSKRVTSS